MKPLEEAKWHIDEAIEMLVGAGGTLMEDRGEDKEDNHLVDRALRNIEIAKDILSKTSEKDKANE